MRPVHTRLPRRPGSRFVWVREDMDNGSRWYTIRMRTAVCEAAYTVVFTADQMRARRLVAGELRSIRPSNVQSIEAGLYIADAKKRIADSVRAAGQDVTASLKTYDTAYNQLVANSNPKAFREFLLSAPRMFLDLGEKIGAISHIASFWRFRFPRDQAIRIDAEELIAIFQDFETSFGIVQSQTFARAS